MMDEMENMMENDGEHADETSKSSNESNAKKVFKVFKVISQSLTNLRILNLIYAGQLLGLWKLWI